MNVNSVKSTKPPGEREWTADQRAAIQTMGTSLLVSAAAGSGKTTVLAERCVHLLCDPDDPCEAGDLLVVTFTESAAAEMKSRIAQSLAARHAAAPDDLTARHMAMLDRAHIGTLHSFCARVLREHFQKLGIDPNFRILDGDEAKLLKLDVARELFAYRYDDAEDDDFRTTVDCYSDGDDEKLVRQVIRAYDTLCSVVDQSGWLERARLGIEEAIDLPMKESRLGQAYLVMIRRDLVSVARKCEASGKAVKGLKNFPTYVQALRDLWAISKHWLDVFDSKGIDALAEEAGSLEFPRLQAVSNSIDGKDIAKARVDAIRNEMKCGAWRQNLLFTTDEWKEGLRLTLPHVDVFLSLVSGFAQRYTLAKGEAGTLDFADLEQLTLQVLKAQGTEATKKSLAPTPIARRYHHQFRHVLVDEYQDINEVQDAILSLVSRECLGKSSGLPANLFCVGDVKQSIYRFRLAEAAQFQRRREAYEESGSCGQVIDLQANFRSRAALLEAINSVFEKLMTKDAAELDYDESQRLVPIENEIPRLAFPNIPQGFCGSPIELHLVMRGAGPVATDCDPEETDLDQVKREATLVGKRILEMIGRTDRPAMQVVDGKGSEATARPIRFGDIVILLRAMRFKADQYVAALRELGVPVHSASTTGYFESTEVNDVLSLLHVLDNQRQDIPLAALLRSPFAGLGNPEDNLTRIRLAYSGEPPVPFHLAVQRYADEQTDDLAQFLRGFRAKLQKWRQEIRQRPVAELLWGIYDQTGYLAYVSGLPNGEQRQANLIELHNRARQFGTFERQGLGRFLTFLEKLKKESDLGQAAIASQADDVVRIMTIHASKGQEFPVVFVPDLGKAINLTDRQGSILLDRAAGLGLQVVDQRRQIRYPSLASTVVAQQLKQQALAEELRVLYVAMTRAKEHLILVGSCTEKQANDWPGQWADHTGPLPAEAVQCARSPLEWLGPVAGLLTDQIRISIHKPEDLAAWAAGHAAPPVMTPQQTAKANGQPIVPPPAVSPEAQGVIDRMADQYAHRSIGNRAATASVTSLVKSAAPISSTALPSMALDRLLGQPEFLAGKLPLDAADIGTATHAVLELFDFTQTPDSLPRQITRLIETRRLSQELADLVDVQAIQWFLQSEIGILIRDNADRLKRELAVYYANPSEATTDAFDQQMIRGRIDLLVPTDGGWMIVDYKTDRVSGADLETRVQLYTGQLDVYRKAVQQITGKPVTESALIFLSPRQIRRV